jgi:hypothetical protein
LPAQQGGGCDQLGDRVDGNDARMEVQRITGRAGVAAAAVCDAAACWAASVVPVRTAMTGLRAASRRASRLNLCGLPNDSRYSTAISVRSSLNHQRSRSLLLMSYLSPSDTKVDTPSPR